MLRRDAAQEEHLADAGLVQCLGEHPHLVGPSSGGEMAAV